MRAGINANRRLYSPGRRACPFIPAGPGASGCAFYSRRAVLLFPQGRPYSRGRAGAAAPGGIWLRVLPGLRRRRWPGSVPPDMRARDSDSGRYVCLLRSAVARRPGRSGVQAASERLPEALSPRRRGQDRRSSLRGPDEPRPTVDDRDSGRAHRDSRPSSACQERIARG
jgi:hypothetical protein